MIPVSSRWSNLNCFDRAMKTRLESSGIASLPRLWCLTQPYHVELSKLMMPSLSHFDAFGMTFTMKTSLMEQITSLTLRFTSSRYHLDVGKFARVVYAMTNLKDLSLAIHYAADNDSVSPLDASEVLKPHSFHIESLSISLQDVVTSAKVVKPLYSCLSYFTPRTVSIYVSNILTKKSIHDFFYYDFEGKCHSFLYGSTIRIVVQHECDVFYILRDVLKRCDIAHSVHIWAPQSYFTHRSLPPSKWPDVLSIPLRHLCLQSCDRLTEDNVEALAKYFLSAEEGRGLQTLDIRSCKKISEKPFFNLGDEIEHKIKWSFPSRDGVKHSSSQEHAYFGVTKVLSCCCPIVDSTNGFRTKICIKSLPVLARDLKILSSSSLRGESAPVSVIFICERQTTHLRLSIWTALPPTSPTIIEM
ncbi:hypothetical protein BD410DRAFT_867416 [Rickenella mellea]|uniref:F-box domain-containing protein n=1 Tax=Rickenella mellea TaxID=50990 RepID=A0A4Y7Q1L5_9AGAM|nr:hypothetical protein BD410DRAFT_867416 [Rickenella mellea]